MRVIQDKDSLICWFMCMHREGRCCWQMRPGCCVACRSFLLEDFKARSSPSRSERTRLPGASQLCTNTCMCRRDTFHSRHQPSPMSSSQLGSHNSPCRESIIHLSTVLLSCTHCAVTMISIPRSHIHEVDPAARTIWFRLSTWVPRARHVAEWVESRYPMKNELAKASRPE